MDYTKQISDFILTANRSSWSIDHRHGAADTPYKKIKEIYEKVLSRDNFSCYLCGFKSSRFQEVHHLNHNHSDCNLNNLKTVCPLCHQVFHLSSAGSTGGGKIIWLPEIPQHTLNILLIYLFLALRQKKDLEGAARSLYGEFESRTSFVEENLAMGASDPSVFAQALLQIPNDFDKTKSLYPFRLLASPSRFEIQLDFWEKEVDKKSVPFSEWLSSLPIDFNMSAVMKKIKGF